MIYREPNYKEGQNVMLNGIHYLIDALSCFSQGLFAFFYNHKITIKITELNINLTVLSLVIHNHTYTYILF